MATRTRKGDAGVLEEIRTDLRRLHDGWMALVFPRQRGRGHAVMGRWTPETTPQQVGYYGWGIVGALGLLALYPLTVLGFATRYYAATLDSTRTRLGIAGVTALAVLAWGGLTALAHLRLEPEAVLAVAAAGVVATGSTALAAACSRIGGRPVSVLLAYPFALTALFLPPVVAALVTPSLEDVVLEPSYAFAVQLLEGPLAVGGINELLRANFELAGTAYAAMWTAIAFPLGWLLGGAVALANLVRPSS
ncbi:hypothetical protein [Natronococcus occultus]|uniref:Uncharacterized protein n=1 Tax=Natronococcus occultus SP4 TaxID=694430 RepID=L0K2D0_9EURY|nr:hypothetical protein [Natronococcus occultus]AGB39452.1 hypothetical protein Natoc_3738 [Natronococcus occultus SP4]